MDWQDERFIHWKLVQALVLLGAKPKQIANVLNSIYDGDWSYQKIYHVMKNDKPQDYKERIQVSFSVPYVRDILKRFVREVQK